MVLTGWLTTLTTHIHTHTQVYRRRLIGQITQTNEPRLEVCFVSEQIVKLSPQTDAAMPKHFYWLK